MEQPRDMREWMRTIERNVREARLAGRNIAGALVDDAIGEVVDDINKDRNRVPTAPIELTYQTFISLDPVTKKMKAGINVDFPDVTKATDGNDITIERYELWGRKTVPADEPFTLQASSSRSAIQNYGYDPANQWEFKVRAIGEFTIAPGVFSETFIVTMTADSVPPPQPSAPVVTAKLGALTLKWDGLSVSGDMPADTAYVIVAGGPASNPTTKVATFYPGGPAVTVFSDLPFGTPMFYRLQAFDFTGNASPWSVQATGIPQKLVDTDLILAEIDGNNTILKNIGAEAIKDGAILSAKLADNAVTQAKLQDQIISLAKLDTSANNKIQQGINDAATAQTAANTANTAAGTAQTAADAAQKLVDAKIAAGTNLVLNGSWEDGNTHWTTNASAFTRVPTLAARTGTKVMYLNPDAGNQWPTSANWVPSAKGRTFYLETYARKIGTAAGVNDTVAFVVQSSTTAGGTSTIITTKTNASALSETAWTKITATYTIPDTVDAYRSRFAPWANQSTNDYEFDDMLVVDMTESKAALDAAALAQSKADTAFADAQTALTNAGLAQTAANGKNSIYYGNTAPAGSGFKINDVWFRGTDNKLHMWDGDSWEARADTAIATAQSAATAAQTAATNADTKATNAATAATNAQTAADNAQTAGDNAALLANSVVKTSTSDATGVPPSTGALWNKVNTAGDLIIKTWTSNAAGTAWIERKLDDAVIGNLNAATINAGIISAARFNAADIRAKFLEAGKITANDIVAGTLTSASGIFGTMDASVINAGTINAARLLAGDIRAKFLAAGLITAADMVTGTITAQSGVIASLDLGKATVGELDGIYVKANSLRAKSLLVSDLVTFAPSPAESPDDWEMTNGMVILTTNLDPSGKRHSVTDNANTAYARAPYKAVTPGEKLYGYAKVYRDTGATQNVYLRYYWYDKDKVSLADAYEDVPNGLPQAANTTVLDGVVTVPADAAYARYTFVAGAGTGSVGWYLIAGRRQTGAVYIEDGAVTADKVAADAIQAKHIVVGDFANLAIGSDFEDPAAVPWTLAPKHILSTATKKSGTTSLRLGPDAVIQKSIFSGDMRVKEGEQWYIKLHAYLDSAFNGTGNSKLRVGTPSGTHIVSIDYSGITRSAWTTVPLEAVVTVPAGITSLAVELWSDNTAGYAYVDDIQIRRMSEASLIQNLGVEKLTASAASIGQAVVDKLWAEVIRAKKITSDMIVVGRGLNLIADPYFDDPANKTLRHDKAGWGAWAVSASNSLNIYTDGSLSAGTAYSFHYGVSEFYDKNAYIPVKEGESYRLRVMYTSGTSGPRATVTYVMADGTTGYTANGWTTGTGTANVYDPAGTLRTLDRIYTVPTGVTHIMPAVQFESTCTSATVYGGGSLVSMASASLIVDGSIIADKIGVNAITTDKINALAISTDKIQSNAITAIKINAGAVEASKLEATMILTTTIIAGNENGNHARMEPSGFKAYALPVGGGVPLEAIRLGTTNDDYLAVTRADGMTTASIDDTGRLTGSEVHARDELYYQGDKLSDLLWNLPQGILTAAYRTTDSTINAEVGANIAFLRLEATLKPGRVYRVATSPLKITRTAGSVLVGIRYSKTGLATLSSGPLTETTVWDEANAPTMEELFSLTTETQDTTVSFLLWMGVAGGSAGFRPSVNYPARMYVEDMGPLTNQIANGVALNGSVTSSAAKNTYKKQYTSTVSRSYIGDNTLYALDTTKLYQGQSPTGNGIMKSIATGFGTMTADLTGATINYIRVYLNFEHWYYNSGGTAYIYVHGHSSAPTTFSVSGGVQVTSTKWPRPGARWITLPSSLHAGFIAGTYKGVALFGTSSYTSYGIAQRPIIEVSYNK